MPFDQGGVGLVDAIRIALENDPNIQLQTAGVMLSAGVTQEQSGAFDWTFGTDVSYEYRKQEVRESIVDGEAQRRLDLQEDLEVGVAFRDITGAQITALQTLLQRLNRTGRLGSVFIPGDPFLTTQLQFINALLRQNRQQGNDAIVDELIAVARDLMQSRLDLLSDANPDTRTGQSIFEQQADLDELGQKIADLGPTPEDEEITAATLETTLRKTFAAGFTVSPFVMGELTTDRFVDKPISADFGGKGIEDLYTFRVGLQVIIPLGRGRGARATAAGLRSAEREEQASRYFLEHQVAATVLQTALAYWDLRTQQASHEIAQRSLELQTELRGVTEAMIEVGLQTQGELFRSQASEARAASRVQDAERGLHQARVNLATVLGVGATSDFSTLPLARDDYPMVPDSVIDDAAITALVTEGPNNRRDLLALRESLSAGRILEAGAGADKRPIVDLTVASWYTSLADKNLGDSLERWVGPSVSVDLGVDLPLGNNLAQGRYAQSQADVRQRVIDLTDADRVVRLAIVREATALREAANSVRAAQAAVDAYEQTYQTEVQKLRDGDSTLVDTLLTEDQMTSARLDLARAQSEYAKTLARLRFEAGRLVDQEADGQAVVRESLLTVPTAQGGSDR